MINRLAALVASFLVISVASVGPAQAQSQQPPTVKIPEAGVRQIMTMEGAFVRAAYNNEGYTILGYRLANMSIGEEWMLIEVGMTVRDGVPGYKLVRDAVSLTTPDNKTIPMASVSDYREANLRALEERAKIIRDSINYFPPSARRSCRIGFFSPLGAAPIPWDQVELSSERACLGRLYFKIPGGIAYGQHWLNVKFEQSTVRVPFRILTKDEEKTLAKHYKSISRQVKEAFAPKKK
jgi:hypothetical protein